MTAFQYAGEITGVDRKVVDMAGLRKCLQRNRVWIFVAVLFDQQLHSAGLDLLERQSDRNLVRPG
jgi:hypothetical protein